MSRKLFFQIVGLLGVAALLAVGVHHYNRESDIKRVNVALQSVMPSPPPPIYQPGANTGKDYSKLADELDAQADALDAAVARIGK